MHLTRVTTIYRTWAWRSIHELSWNSRDVLYQKMHVYNIYSKFYEQGDYTQRRQKIHITLNTIYSIYLSQVYSPIKLLVCNVVSTIVKGRIIVLTHVFMFS